MTGNVALDIFIGIVFVYLLYSLLATIIMEIIATFLDLRAKNLQYALKMMLRDEKEGSKFLRKLWTSVTRIFGYSCTLELKDKSKDLYKLFIDQPSIKYLGGGTFFKMPSYFTSQNFAKALVDTLKAEKSQGNLLERINTGISELPIGPETKTHLNSLLEDANNDVQKFRLLLGNWFDNTMERSIGWYKKNTQFFLLVIGFMVAVAFNANTFQIIQKLSKDDKAREQLVMLSASYLKENQDVIAKLDSLKQSDVVFPSKFDTLLSIREDLRNDIARANSVISLSWPRMDSTKIDSVSSENGARQMIPIGKKDSKIGIYYPVNVDKTLFEKALEKKEGVIVPSKHDKVKFRKNRYLWSMVGKNFWGYLVTALFISLGAPFWFDLLNKVVKLRTSVAQATSSVPAKKPAGNTNNDNTSTLKRKG